MYRFDLWYYLAMIQHAQPPIISIDWDHTLRNLQGLDLNILALINYAKAKKIPVGLTTHRDIENTTLYSLYYWQNQQPANIKIPLAAAISYWPVTVDFINARYQPLYLEENYYEKIILPHEKMLAFEINENKLLADPNKVKSFLAKYHEFKEGELKDNEFKEAQINWLNNQYKGTIYHIDDNQDVCRVLPKTFKNVQTFWYQQAPLLANESCGSIFNDIGFIEDWDAFIAHEGAPFSDNEELYLSLCLFATQYCYHEINFLEKIALHLNQIMSPQVFLIKDLIQQIKEKQQPVHFILNERI